MNETPADPDRATRTGLAAVAVGVPAVLCYAGAPLVAAVLGGVALGAVLGVAAGVIAVIGLTVMVVVMTRRRRAAAAQAVEPADGS